MKKDKWINGPLWDSFWFLAGIWLLPVVLLCEIWPRAVFPILAVATPLLWIAHRLASAYTAYCTPHYQNLAKVEKIRFFLLPLAIVAVVFLFTFLPQSLLPLEMAGRVAVLATVFFVYNTFHFGVQHFGVVSIYKKLAGQKSPFKGKNSEKYFFIFLGGVMVAIGQIYHGAEVVKDSLISPLNPAGELLPFGKGIALLVVILMTFIYLERDRRVNAAFSWPKTLYVLSVAAQAVLAFFLSPTAFLLLWGVPHWMISVALGGQMCRTTGEGSSSVPSFFAKINRSTIGVILFLVLVGIVLTPFFDLAIHPQRALPGLRVLLNLQELFQGKSLLRDFFIAISFSTVYCHFTLDRALFRFSHPEVRKITWPLIDRKGR